MNFPSGTWNEFQPLSPVQYAQDQQALAENNQLGQLQIDTKKQEMQTENALAPFKVQQAGYAAQQGQEENDLRKTQYENQAIADVAQRAQAADPEDAPRVWDDGMNALADKGIGSASQYVGHYRSDLADKVHETFAPEAQAGGRRGATGASEDTSNFDSDAVNRAIANVPAPMLKKSLANLNRAIGSFNNVKDADSWNAEIAALRESGIDPSTFLPSLEFNPLNYAAAHRMVQNLARYRDAVSDRLSATSVGLPGTTPKPLYEPSYQYIGTDSQGRPVTMDTRSGQAGVGYNAPINPKPSAGASNTLLKQKMWLSVHPGDEQGALEYANGKRSMDPGQIQLSALTEANRELYDVTAAGTVIANPAQWVKTRQAEIVSQVNAANAPMMGSQPRAAAAPPQRSRMTRQDMQASIANARSALQRHPDKRAVILSRLKAAGIPATGL